MVEVVKKNWVAVADVKEIVPGSPKVVDLENLRIALFNVEGPEGGLYAIEDVCTHDDGPVAEGTVDGSVIECPRHGAKFDIKTGAVICMPAVTPIRTFPVRVNGEDIEVELEL